MISLAVLSFAGCQSPSNDASAAKPKDALSSGINANAIRVETMTVSAESQTLSLRLPAEVESSRRSRLASATGGFVQKLFVQRGDRVKKGQELAWVNRDVADAQLAQAKANLELAQYEMELVKTAGESMPKTRQVQASARLKTAQAGHRLAAINARRSRIRAPFNGVVSRTNLEVGEVLAPGQMVIMVEKTDSVKVTVSVSDRDIRWIKKGVPALIRLDGGASTIDAKVSRVGPAADLETRTFIAEIDVPNKSYALRPGMLGTVTISSKSNERSVAIPQFALVTGKDGNGVFVVEEKKAKWRPLKIDKLRGHSVIIADGIQADDEVIIRGHRELNDGDDVIVVKLEGDKAQ
ncbi:MAG: efflux RND transporter periplasmic adaptor subunit [Myxococcota bacterium]|nr:efflux RND transporter periplasmic adaptor subunit [Myxococcota bacterium]